jgi:hypothetical protein
MIIVTPVKSDLVHQLERVDANPDIALLCINDDLPQASVKPAEAVLRSWFEHRWPDKLECEL